MLCLFEFYLFTEQTCCTEVVSSVFQFLRGENVVRWQTNHCRSHCLWNTLYDFVNEKLNSRFLNTSNSLCFFVYLNLVMTLFIFGCLFITQPQLDRMVLMH